MVLHNDGYATCELSECDMFTRACLLPMSFLSDGLTQEAISENFFHNLDKTQLAVWAAVVLQRQQNGCNKRSWVSVCIIPFLIKDIADSLAHTAEGHVGNKCEAVCYLGLLWVIGVPSIDFH